MKCTGLMYACENGRILVIKLLLDCFKVDIE